MSQLLLAPSFQSPWYWTLHVVVWAIVCLRTLGVPYDMLLRARRLPEVAARVDLLANLTAERLAGAVDAAGAPLAAVIGFLLAALAGIGFASGIEAAQAIFLLGAPLAVIGYSKVRLAFWIRRSRLVGPRLVLALSGRRTCHQAIAILAMLAAVVVATALHGGAI
ncbi:MAG TPA: hypothetical protein VM422_08260 [Amaricoccus sp.]|nr:hypothetical protein [Amaricoccus sp.]